MTVVLNIILLIYILFVFVILFYWIPVYTGMTGGFANTSLIIPALFFVIPALFFVIPAKAGI